VVLYFKYPDIFKYPVCPHSMARVVIDFKMFVDKSGCSSWVCRNHFFVSIVQFISVMSAGNAGQDRVGHHSKEHSDEGCSLNLGILILQDSLPHRHNPIFISYA
jgi:hypothetical protein